MGGLMDGPTTIEVLVLYFYDVGVLLKQSRLHREIETAERPSLRTYLPHKTEIFNKQTHHKEKNAF